MGVRVRGVAADGQILILEWRPRLCRTNLEHQMRPLFEKVTIPEGASWSLLDRRLDDGIPFQWHYHPEFEIHLIQHGIQKLLSLFPGDGISPVERDEYNRHMANVYDPIRDFIILHYKATKRTGPFWDHVREMAIPDSLEHKIELFREHGRVFRYNEELFDLPSWVAVMLGQEIIPDSYDPLVDGLPDNELIRAMTDLKRGYEETALRLPLASDYIRQRLAA